MLLMTGGEILSLLHTRQEDFWAFATQELTPVLNYLTDWPFDYVTRDLCLRYAGWVHSAHDFKRSGQ